MSEIELKEVRRSDAKFLFTLLKERKTIVNISHKKMPTYEQHYKFVMSEPYSNWYIIYHKNKKIGSIYLSKQNEIGISIKKKLLEDKFRQISLETLMEKNPRVKYIVNCNPKNTKLIRFFKRNNFKLVQYSYEFIPFYKKKMFSK